MVWPSGGLQKLPEVLCKQHLPALASWGCRSPPLAWMLSCSQAVTGLPQPGPISPRNFLGGLSRSPAAGSTTHRSSTSLQDRAGAELEKRQQQGSSKQSSKHALAPKHPNSCLLCSTPLHCTNIQHDAQLQQPFLGTCLECISLLLVHHCPPGDTDGFFLMAPLGKHSSTALSCVLGPLLSDPYWRL